MEPKILTYLPISHVLTPLDDYSPSNSSAIATVVCEFGRIHINRGGSWEIIGTSGKKNDYGIGQVKEVPYSNALKTRYSRVDKKLAQLGFPRYFGERHFSPSHTAFSSNHSGPIFLHNCEYGVSAMRRHLPQAKLFLWMHNEFRAKFSQREAQKMLSQLDGVVCVSQYIADYIRSVAGNGNWPLYVLNNGVNTEKFAPPPESMPRDADGVPTIVFVGKLNPKKGPHLLVEAAEILARGHRKFKVRFIGSAKHGDPNSTSDYEKELREKTIPLRDFIEWGGYRDRHAVAAEYARASIFCAPAIWNDPCPLTILEALSSGCAVVTTRRGGIVDEAGDSALYFDPLNVQSLADVLARLIDNVTLRQEYGRKARARALLFSWENQYDKFCDLLPLPQQEINRVLS